ncbi:MAG TPA: isochorismatase family cysteine hydrolase [Syntrophales bacterium]|nr:cysteine hydrolase [Syntrophobacterales bacterium]HQL89586.1 isochorismatase family cysteine hydrolase [Syntrophales bacterium]
MKPAVVIVDMLKDTLEGAHPMPIKELGRAIVPAINRLTEAARARAVPVIFSMDSFLPGDFIFQGRMKNHSIRGTRGAEVTDLLVQAETDLYCPKRRFSAFYKTDLDQTLRLLGADTVALCGIATHWCVLSSAFDALSNDFRVIILEDCCASFSREMHESCLAIYRRNPLEPLLRVMGLEAFLAEVAGT